MAIQGRLTSLNSLRAFEAVSRVLSFSRAADELHVTKAAVAQQVRLLEAEIGTPLVDRTGRGLRLTEAGVAGLTDLRDGFGLLHRAARAMREASGGRMLVIHSSSSFAATWLVARIGRFKKTHPDLDVLLDTGNEAPDLAGSVDAAIRWGRGEFPGASATLLFHEHVFPVCSPSLLTGEHPIRGPPALVDQTLLHLEWNPNFAPWPDWGVWLSAAGVRNVDTSHGVWFNQMALALQAAVQGQGVTLATRAIAGDEMAAGRLVAPFSTEVSTPFGYYFLCRSDQVAAPKIVAFRDWLMSEAMKS